LQFFPPLPRFFSPGSPSAVPSFCRLVFLLSAPFDPLPRAPSFFSILQSFFTSGARYVPVFTFLPSSFLPWFRESFLRSFMFLFPFFPSSRLFSENWERCTPMIAQLLHVLVWRLLNETFCFVFLLFLYPTTWWPIDAPTSLMSALIFFFSTPAPT